jgi:S-adenosyl methyltransferase
MNDPDAVEPTFDPDKPTTARVYDYVTGGKNNFSADRAVADEILRIAPDAKEIAASNRRFINRALWHVAGQGIRQFADIGAGMPLPSSNTHQIALGNHSTARTVYVDCNSQVVNHLKGTLEMHPQVAAMHGDLRNPRDIMTSSIFSHCIDLSQPVAVLLGAVLHFLPDPDALDVVEYIKRGLSKGSYLIVSHATADGTDQATAREVQDKYAQRLDPLTLRTHAEVTKFFDGWELEDPGVVKVNDWRPTEKAKLPANLYGGVAFKK